MANIIAENQVCIKIGYQTFIAEPSVAATILPDLIRLRPCHQGYVSGTGLVCYMSDEDIRIEMTNVRYFYDEKPGVDNDNEQI